MIPSHNTSADELGTGIGRMCTSGLEWGLAHREALVQGMSDLADGLATTMTHEITADAAIVGTTARPRVQGSICALNKQSWRA